MKERDTWAFRDKTAYGFSSMYHYPNFQWVISVKLYAQRFSCVCTCISIRLAVN